MMRRYPVAVKAFDNEDIGYISFGPNARLKFCFTTYRDDRAKLRYHCDARKYTYGVTTNKYYASKLGIVLKMDFIKTLIEVLMELPKEITLDKEEYTLVVVPKGKYKEIRARAVLYEGRVYIDIREWASMSLDGHTGYMNNGIRVAYDLKDELVRILSAVYNKMIEFGIEHGVRDNGEKIEGWVKPKKEKPVGKD